MAQRNDRWWICNSLKTRWVSKTISLKKMREVVEDDFVDDDDELMVKFAVLTLCRGLIQQ